MSTTYEALKRAEAAQAGRVEAPLRPPEGRPPKVEPPEGNGRAAPNGRPAPWLPLELPDPNRVEYQKIGVRLTVAPSAGERVKTVMIVGCRSGSGCTTTASILAVSLAESKRRVLLVEANLRTPALSDLFEVTQPEGLSDVLAEKLPIQQSIQATHHPGLFVLTGGRLSGSFCQVLDGDAIDQYLPELRQEFDLIIFDAPPVIEYPDACALVSKVDRVLLVVEADRTSIEDAQRAKRDLEQAGGRLLGVVINRQKDYIPRRVKRFFAPLA